MKDERGSLNRSSRFAGYIPTLDGWRTLSIISVILFHDSSHHLGPFNTNWFQNHGYLGVDVFFAISGLLICSRLMNEEQVTGSISVRNFYARRVFRILPPSIFFLMVLLVLKRAIHLQVGVPEVLASLLFVRNYTFFFFPFQSLYPAYTSHFWSLAVEEHFYLLLPATLVFFRRWRLPILFGSAILVGFTRVIHTSSFHTNRRIDALLVPAAIAILVQQSAVRERLVRWLRFWPVLAIGLLILITFDLFPRTTGLLIVWLTPLLILGTAFRPESWFSRFLELPWMRYIGRLSYSLYLWQQLFFIWHVDSGEHMPGRLVVLQNWPWSVVMVAAVALFSYYFIEQPFIRLGHKLAPNVAANRTPRSEGQVAL